MKKLAILFFAIGILGSCTKQDSETVLFDNEINGLWKMVSYMHFGPTVPEMENDEIIWTFNLETNILTVQNSVEDEFPFILASGEYPFSYSLSQITIEAVEYDYTVENDVLILSDMPEADGPMIRFERE